MPHMHLGAHEVAISTIFNVDFFKQIQQIQILTDTDTPKFQSIQILTDTDNPDTHPKYQYSDTDTEKRVVSVSVSLRVSVFVKSPKMWDTQTQDAEKCARMGRVVRMRVCVSGDQIIGHDFTFVAEATQ